MDRTGMLGPRRRSPAWGPRRLGEIGIVIATVASLPAVVLGLWACGWYANVTRPRAVAALPGERRGTVWKIEPLTKTIHVSSKPFGLDAVAVAVADDTPVLVGDKEGAFGDFHEGTRVRVVYERRDATLVALCVEVLNADGPTGGAGSMAVFERARCATPAQMRAGSSRLTPGSPIAITDSSDRPAE
jgi:hypothetical protein